MTPDEYTTWAKFHNHLFPDFGSWWLSLAPGTQNALRDEWRAILSRVCLSDACDASRRMLAGTADLCPAWERSLLASRIAAIAREIVNERSQPSEYEISERQRPVGSPAGNMYRQILERIEAGEDPRTAATAVIPEVLPTTNQRQYSCRRCWDSGLVHVWHHLSVHCLLRGEELTRANRRTMTVACACKAGDSLCITESQSRPKAWHGWRQSARYAPESYCLCQGADVDDPARIAELHEWVADYPAKRRQVPEHMREKTFEHWNNS